MKAQLRFTWLLMSFALVNCGEDTTAKIIKAKTSQSNQEQTGRASQYIVFDLSKLPVQSYKTIGVHLKGLEAEFDVKKMYGNGTTTIREFVSPGKYAYRIVYVDDNGKVIFDSAVCSKKEGTAPTAEKTPADPIVSDKDLKGVVAINQNEEKTIVIEDCKLDADELAKEPEIPEFDRLHNPEYEGPGWPNYPRRYLVAGRSVINSNTLNAELGIKFWDLASTGATASTGLTIQYKSEAFLVKHAPSADTIILVPGTSKLAYEEGVAFVGQCNYVAAVSGSVGAGVKIGVSVGLPFGANGSAGGASNLAIEKATLVQAQSKFFTIRPNETVDDIKERCNHLFMTHVKEGVTRDLKQNIKDALFRDDRDNFELIYEAAIHGPELKGVEANGYKWNVKKSQVTFEENKMVISGQLSRRKKAAVDDQFCYSIVVTNQANGRGIHIPYQRYDNCNGKAPHGDWAEAAKEIAKNIALDSWKANKGF